MLPVATEFAADGTVLWEATGIGARGYRVARDLWTGRPATDPDVAVRAAGAGRQRVAMSWNGATEVASWRVLTGPSEAALAEATSVERTGFEATAVVDEAARVQVEALDATGSVLGRSRLLRT